MKIIDNKKIDLTDFEWTSYQNICRSYDRPNFKGEELFKNLFETDNKGQIIFIRPPTDRFISMEVFLFVCSVYNHQAVRQNKKTVDELVQKYEQTLKELTEKIKDKTV